MQTILVLMRITCQRQGRMIQKMLISSVVRAELEQGMVKSGQFTQQESKLVFEIADIDGNGNQLLEKKYLNITMYFIFRNH